MSATLFFSLFMWLSSTGLINMTIPQEPPDIWLVDENNMALQLQRCLVLNYRIGKPEKTQNNPYMYKEFMEVASNVGGLYCNDRIVISNRYGGFDNLQTQSFLIHEMVHWIQHHTGMLDKYAYDNCPKRSEVDAYKVQLQFAKENDLPPNINALGMWSVSTCNH